MFGSGKKQKIITRGKTSIHEVLIRPIPSLNQIKMVLLIGFVWAAIHSANKVKPDLSDPKYPEDGSADEPSNNAEVHSDSPK